MALMLWKMEQNRHLARMEAWRLWKLVLMLWKGEQNRHLARRRQASRQASIEAMEIAAKERRAWLG